MQRWNLSTTLFISLLCLQAQAFAQEQIDELSKVLTGGKLKLDIRYRNENVNDDVPGLETAKANTLRTRLGYESAGFYGFSLYGEFEDIREIIDDQFNSGPNGNGKTRFATVADPQETELNQLFLQHANTIGPASIQVRHGRERQKWDNDHFIGNVGWRQNEQTFDGTSLILGLKDIGLTFRYAHHTNMNRIFGDQADTVGDFNVDSNNFNLNYTGLKFLNASVYYYDWDSDEPATNAGGFSEINARETYGVRLLGNIPINDKFTLLATAEYASQDDQGDAPSFSSLDYTLFELGAAFKVGVPLTVKITQETLEGDIDDGQSFITPFATLHAFQGWADVFLGSGTTGIYGGQAAGIEDTYYSIGSSVFGTNLLAVYHEFEPDDSGSNFDDYGSELDLLAARSFAKHYTAGLKYADFDANDGFRGGDDISIFWFWLEAKF